MASASLRGQERVARHLRPDDARQPQRSFELHGRPPQCHQRQRRIGGEAAFVLLAEPGYAVVEESAEREGYVERCASIQQNEPSSDSTLVLTP